MHEDQVLIISQYNMGSLSINGLLHGKNENFLKYFRRFTYNFMRNYLSPNLSETFVQGIFLILKFLEKGPTKLPVTNFAKIIFSSFCHSLNSP